MINIIAAMDPNRVIGKDNKLPWHISEDLKNFKRLTDGNAVIMGRKTYESIGKPLPNRKNIVISTSMPTTNGITVCKSLQEGLMEAKLFGKDIFIIGGASLYEQAIPMTDKMFISYVKRKYAGDVFFPEFDENEWEIEQKEDHPDFELVIYVRKHGKPQES